MSNHKILILNNLRSFDYLNEIIEYILWKIDIILSAAIIYITVMPRPLVWGEKDMRSMEGQTKALLNYFS